MMRLNKINRAIFMALTLLLPAGTTGAFAQVTHYVAPLNANVVCKGTQGQETCPWSSVATALQSGTIQGGDTLLLMDGLHDRIEVVGRNFTPPLIIQSKTARNAKVDTIYLGKSSGVTFRELTIQSSMKYHFPLLRSDQDTSRIAIENATLQSVAKVDDVLSWTQVQWLERRRHGIWLLGSESRVLNSSLVAVQSGIWSPGKNNIISGNRITELTSDGLRAGSGNVVRNNYVANFLRVDDDHIDGFQSIGDITNPVRDLVLDGNTILEWAYPVDHPLRASLQGIGMFDGFYDNFGISNNVISVTSHHGISVYGGRGGMIVNNTVVQQSGNPGTIPWIGVFNHKNGTPSQNVTVANNLAMAFSGASLTNNVVLVSNQVILYPNTVFQNVTAFDYRLKADSEMVDTANASFSPAVDINGSARPQGKGPDKGAYEVSGGVQTVPLEPLPAEEPIVTSPEPIVTSPGPIVTSPEPIVTSPEPIVTSPEPIVTSPEPIVTSPKTVAPGKKGKPSKASRDLTSSSTLYSSSRETVDAVISLLFKGYKKPIRERRFRTDGLAN
jgi:parallel beta-helix repeat protein